ncbi:hypothetical protein LCGC14_0208490 [marine sediment metagenome]|uniref:Uncharacterized protein n=1 Tax=marine sediment metagenome TaxID=412755 RepID=A0A0F9XJX5_9ZZZZ
MSNEEDTIIIDIANGDNTPKGKHVKVINCPPDKQDDWRAVFLEMQAKSVEFLEEFMERTLEDEAQAARAVTLWVEVRTQLMQKFPPADFYWKADSFDNVVTRLTIALIEKK